MEKSITDRSIKKISHEASWNKHRNKYETRELSKKIRVVGEREIKKEVIDELQKPFLALEKALFTDDE